MGVIREKRKGGPSVFKFYGNFCEIHPAGRIVEAENTVLIDERQYARTYVLARIQRMQQNNSTIHKIEEQNRRGRETAVKSKKL